MTSVSSGLRNNFVALPYLLIEKKFLSQMWGQSTHLKKAVSTICSCSSPPSPQISTSISNIVHCHSNQCPRNPHLCSPHQASQRPGRWVLGGEDEKRRRVCCPLRMQLSEFQPNHHGLGPSSRSGEGQVHRIPVQLRLLRGKYTGSCL